MDNLALPEHRENKIRFFVTISASPIAGSLLLYLSDQSGVLIFSFSITILLPLYFFFGF